MEKIYVSSAYCFAVDERLLFRSFMHIRKNSGPKTEPWDIAANIGDHKDAWPLKRALLNLPLKKLLISFKGAPEIPADRIL